MSDLVTRLHVISELNLSEGPDVNGALLDEARTEILRLRSLVAATQEKCAQVAIDREAQERLRRWPSDAVVAACRDIASAIRALKMETGHE